MTRLTVAPVRSVLALSPLACAAFLCALPLSAPPPAHAQGTFDFAHEDEDTSPGLVQWKGLVDFRYLQTTKRRSWLYNKATLRAERNKLRYGGKDTNADDVGDKEAREFAVPQANLVLEAGTPDRVQAHVQVNVDTDFETGNGSVGVIEAYAEAERALAANAVRLRMGALIPPLSFEHPDVAWTTRYTITPSALASWVGEDLRGVGGELTWRLAISPAYVSRITGGLFSGSDQSGWVLLERGWALHDFQPDLNYQYPMEVDFEGVQPVHPFKELDGQLGYYALGDFTLAERNARIRLGIWDNRANKKATSIGSHLDVYSTRFWHLGAEYSPVPRATFIAQFADGRSEHASTDPLGRKDFRTWFALGSYQLGRLTATARYDDYQVTHLEDGYAVTGALTLRVGLRNRLTLEYVTYSADREDAGAAGLVVPVPEKLEDDLLSVNARFFFGGL
jgi:hypothetical protein